MNKTELTFFHIKDRMLNHNLLKDELLELINQDDEGIREGNKFIPGYLDDDKTAIRRLDFARHSDLNRPWVKKIENDLFSQFKKMVQFLGFQHFTLKALWYQQYYKNDIHDWHIHTQHYTGVYYLEFPENAPPTILNNNDEIKIPNVEEGDIVMFPAMTPHQGPELKTDERKTIISFNLNVIDINHLNNLRQ